MLKDIFKISITVILIGLGAVALNALFQNIIIFLNTYLDGMYQFIQYFKGLADSEYLLVISSMLILTILCGVFIK